MAGIAGIAKENSYDEVSAMLDMIEHRGRNHREIVRAEGTTIGVCWDEPSTAPVRIAGEKFL
jgi:asparagine synthetase B (glutamine-hydrolysing)